MIRNSLGAVDARSQTSSLPSPGLIRTSDGEASFADSRPLIVHIILRLDVGGMENGLINLINRLPHDRYRHAIICLKDFSSFRKRLTAPDVQVFALCKRDGKDLGTFIRMWHLLRKLKPTVVHTRNIGTIDMVFPAALAGVPVRIHGEHGWDVADLHGDRFKYRLIRQLCRPVVSRYIAVSSHLKTWLDNSIGIAPQRVSHICNGVDTEKFFPVVRAIQSKSPIPFAREGKLIVGTIGRVVEVKDQISLVHAFIALRNNLPSARERLRLVIVGDGPLLEALREPLISADALDYVWLPGRRDDIDEVLRGLDLFVLPSLNEGISNTILEAMASGLPVIATRVGGNPELVQHGKNGTLIPVSAPKVLGQAIENYLDRPDLLEMHGAAARRCVEAEYSLDRMVTDYLQLYDKLIEAAGAKTGVPD